MKFWKIKNLSWNNYNYDEDNLINDVKNKNYDNNDDDYSDHYHDHNNGHINGIFLPNQKFYYNVSRSCR